MPILHNAPHLVGANALNSVLKATAAYMVYVQLYNNGVAHTPLYMEKAV